MAGRAGPDDRSRGALVGRGSEGGRAGVPPPSRRCPRPVADGNLHAHYAGNMTATCCRLDEQQTAANLIIGPYRRLGLQRGGRSPGLETLAWFGAGPRCAEVHGGNRKTRVLPARNQAVHETFCGREDGGWWCARRWSWFPCRRRSGARAGPDVHQTRNRGEEKGENGDLPARETSRLGSRGCHRGHGGSIWHQDTRR